VRKHQRIVITATVGLAALASAFSAPLAGAIPPRPFTSTDTTTSFVPTVNHIAGGNTFYDFVITYTFTYTDTTTSKTFSGTGIGTGSFVVHPDGSGHVEWWPVETGDSLCGTSGTWTSRAVADFTGFPTPEFFSSGRFATAGQADSRNTTGLHTNATYTASLLAAAGTGTYTCR
jgi:hypothetical protein